MLPKAEDIELIAESIHLLDKDFLKDKKIVLFGCTIFARDINNILAEYGLYVDAFIDNNPNKIGKKCMGLHIYKPDELLEKEKDVFVFISSKYSQEMKKQLLSLGCDEKQICIIPVSESKINCGDSVEESNKSIKIVYEGYDIYKSIIENSSMLFLFPYPGTGDIYMACIYLDEYVKKEHISEYKLVVIGNNCKKVAELFTDSPIEVVDARTMSIMIDAWEFLGNDIMNIKPMLHWGWRTKRYLFADKYPHISFNEWFVFDTFKFENYPTKKDMLQEENEQIKNIFIKDGAEKGKIVIIAPYAGSFISGIQDTEWEHMVSILKENGYTVYTNCHGEKEIPIKGSYPIDFSYCNVKEVLEYAGIFVAVRSGLCDIASSSKCEMFVIYEDGFNASNIECFSLKKMKLKLDVHEYCYNNSLEPIIKQILQK